MKLIHVGDLHLGKSLGDFDLIEDQEFILNQIIEIAVEENADGILIAGDVYDKAIPSEAAVNLLDLFLSKLVELKIKVFMISGNHDSDDRLNFGSGLFETNNIFISAVFDGTLYKKTIKDSIGEVNLYLLPFVKASQVKHFYPDASIETYDDAVRTIIENADISLDARNILVAHQFVAGKGEDPKLGGSEGVATQSVGLVEKIGYDCFDAFDYVALGHIHSAQRIGRDEVRYSGSPLKYSLSEVNNDKSVAVVEIGEKGDILISLRCLKPMRDMRHLKGNIEKLLDAKNVSNTQDFMYITLTDEDVINDAMGIIQQTYPNTIKIDYDNSRTKDLDHVDISKITENKSFDELIGDFYKLMYGCDINEEEMEIMQQIAKEAGVVNETN